jgi:hypothetical protein
MIGRDPDANIRMQLREEDAMERRRQGLKWGAPPPLDQSKNFNSRRRGFLFCLTAIARIKFKPGLACFADCRSRISVESAAAMRALVERSWASKSARIS